MKTKEIKLEDLIIGKNQHRTSSVGVEIDELAENIKTRGLLQAIRVVPAESPNKGKYEIIMGQRRFLACKQLGYKTIRADIAEKQEDTVEYLIDSVSENTLRKDTTTQENKDVCAILWRRFGSIRMIVETTGLSDYFVRKHVKWASLPQELRDMVSSGDLQLDAATKAVEVQEYEEDPKIKDTISLAKEMNKLTQGQRTTVKKTKKKNSEVKSKDIITKVKNDKQIPPIPIILSAFSYETIVKLSKNQNKTTVEVAEDIVEEAMNIEVGDGE